MTSSGEPLPSEFWVHNHEALEELSWAIAESTGQFTFLLARCNYLHLREQLIEQLHQRCPVPLRQMTLYPDGKTLYSQMQIHLDQKYPEALLVVGLESVVESAALLSSANQMRESFRQHCPFPIVLWLTDTNLKQLVRCAPDLENWATVTHFTLPPAILLQVLQQAVEQLFDTLLQPNHATAFEELVQEVDLGFLQPSELPLALQSLQRQGVSLEPALQADIGFLCGLMSDDRRTAFTQLQTSLAYWQQVADQGDPMAGLRAGLLQIYVTQTQFGLAEQERQPQPEWAAMHSAVARGIRQFEQAQRPDLVAKATILQQRLLQKLQDWPALADLAQRSLALHEQYGTPFQQAQDYGFWARAALEQQQASVADQAAQAGLKLLDTLPEPHLWLRRLHLLFLAQAQQLIGQEQSAIGHLETARALGDQGRPTGLIRVLNTLRELYFQQGDYLKAFQARRECWSLEQQYGIRAFVGAGRLQARRDPVLDQPSDQVAPEMAAAGRQQDLDRLIERVGRNDCRLIVLHGNSGVGKSSLVNAGLIPTLQQRSIGTRNNVPLVLRVYTNWVQDLHQLLSAALGTPPEPNPTTDLLLAQLQQIDQNQGRLILVLDQFEEFFFVYPNPGQRCALFAFLADCLQILSLKLILSLREDYLHLLLECTRAAGISTLGIDILSEKSRYPIGNFSCEDTRAIIQNLTEQARFYLEPALLDRLVQDLADELGEIRPIELQIIGAQLQADRIRTLAQYEALVIPEPEKGTTTTGRDMPEDPPETPREPKSILVDRYLAGVIADCGPDNQVLAESILYALTDEKGTRPLKTRSELEQEIQSLGISWSSPKPTITSPLDLVFTILVGSGLVVRLPETPDDRYQLVHDYLAELIRHKQAPRFEQFMAELAEIKERNRRNQRRTIAGLLVLVPVLAGLAATAFIFAGQSRQQAIRATNNEIQAISSYSMALYTSRQDFRALLEAIRAFRLMNEIQQINPVQVNPATQAKAIDALQQSIYRVKEFNRLEGNTSWVQAIEFSSDGRLLASGGGDKIIRLWNRDGSLYRELKGHQSGIYRVSFSPDGKRLASVGEDGHLKIWRVTDGKLLQDLTRHGKSRVYGVSFSPDGTLLASSDIAGTIHLWTAEGHWIKALKDKGQAHSGLIFSVNFSPDSQKLVSSGFEDGTIKIWKRDGTLSRRIPAKPRSLFTAKFSPDSQRLAAGVDRTIRLWTLDGRPQQSLPGHAGVVYDVAFSSDGQTIASASADNTVKLWRIADGTLLNTLVAHSSFVIGVSFSPDGQLLASSSQDKTIRLWRLQSPLNQVLVGHQSPVSSVEFSSSGGHLVSGGDRAVILWRQNGTPERILRGNQGPVESISYQNGRIAAVDQSGILRVWQQNGTPLLNFNASKIGMNWLSSVSLSPDSQSVAIGSGDGSVALLPQLRSTPKVLVRNIGSVYDLSFSRDGQAIAAASADGSIRIWQRNGVLLTTVKAHESPVRGLSFSPDGQWLASVGEDATLRLWRWQAPTLQLVETVASAHDDLALKVQFSPDGSKLASSSDDKTIKIWQVSYQSQQNKIRLLTTLKGHEKGVKDISFRADGKALASASVDETVMFWNLEQLSPKTLLTYACDWVDNYISTNPTEKNSDRQKDLKFCRQFTAKNKL